MKMAKKTTTKPDHTKARLLTTDEIEGVHLESFGCAVPIDSTWSNTVKVRGMLNGCPVLLRVDVDSAHGSDDRKRLPRRVKVTVNKVLE